MPSYHCPLCGQDVERNLTVFLDHTDRHVIEQIKKSHPEWVENDGTCTPCADYYRKQLSGDVPETNIGPRGSRNRLVTGILLLAVGFAMSFYYRSSEAALAWKMSLAIPIFLGIFCLLEAKRKTCSLLAEIHHRDMDDGKKKIDDRELALKIRARGRIIILQSFLAAAAATFILVWFL